MTNSVSQQSFLEGYRVLDLTDEKGIYCTKLLADLGADVIIVEPPSGHKVRHRGPFFHDEIHPEKSLNFLYFNTDKRSITLNLEHPDGQVILKELVKTADVAVETFPVGYLKNLGLDYEALSAINPKLVMASITPFGQTGPYSSYKSSDIISMAMSGYMQITGEPDGPPLRLASEQSHYPASQHAAVGVVGGLYYRDVTSGRGQYIDISMYEAIIVYYMEQHPAVCWTLCGENVTRVGLRSQLAVPIGTYPTKDGWTCALSITPPEWDSYAQWIFEVTGDKGVLAEKYRGSVQARRNYPDEVNAYMMGFTVLFSKDELFHEGQRRNVVFYPANSIADLLHDPHLAASNFWVELDHPVVGKLKYPRSGPFYGEDVPELKKAAPLLGESNEEIYCGELGFTKEDLATLRSCGVI